MSESKIVQPGRRIVSLDEAAGKTREPVVATGRLARTMNAVGQEVYDAIAKQHAAAFQALHDEIENDLVQLYKTLRADMDRELYKRSLRGRLRRAFVWCAIRWGVLRGELKLVREPAEPEPTPAISPDACSNCYANRRTKMGELCQECWVEIRREHDRDHAADTIDECELCPPEVSSVRARMIDEAKVHYPGDPEDCSPDCDDCAEEGYGIANELETQAVAAQMLDVPRGVAWEPCRIKLRHVVGVPCECQAKQPEATLDPPRRGAAEPIPTDLRAIETTWTAKIEGK